MKIVIDTNVIISMLIKPGKNLDLFFKDALEIYAPNLLLEELEHNRTTILEKSLLDKDEIDELLLILKKRITFIDEKDYLVFREEANTVCPDKKDIVYFALALYLKCALWSQEKGLKKQDSVTIYDTRELMGLIV